MPVFGISFAGHHIRIKYESEQVATYLNVLFADLSAGPTEHSEIELSIRKARNSGSFIISSGSVQLFEGQLGVEAAATLYDTVIYNLLNHNNNGVALHSGAVSHKGHCILLPGGSGAGKSSVAAYLTANGFNYATDELIFFSNPTMNDFFPFTRPVCLKAGSIQALAKEIISPEKSWLVDGAGAIIPHRFLNPSFSNRRLSPELILFPFYKNNAMTRVEKLSGAQASARLMGCCANARNLAGHGFKQIVSLARLKPAFQLTFGSFSGLEMTVKNLLGTLDT